jgi:hypothetical protein
VVFDGFLKGCLRAEAFTAWRPNLPDEANDHFVELTVAENAAAIVIRNNRDLKRTGLRSPAMRISFTWH